MNHNTFIASMFLAVLLLLSALCIYDLSGGKVTFSDVGNLLTGIATIVGAGVAVVGLSSWKKQQAWLQNRDLASKIISAYSLLEQSIQNARVYPHEADISISFNVKHAQSNLEIKNRNNKIVSEIETKMRIFSEVASQAKLLWGNGFEDVVFALENNVASIKKLYDMKTALLEPDLPDGHTWLIVKALRLEKSLSSNEGEQDELGERLRHSKALILKYLTRKGLT